MKCVLIKQDENQCNANSMQDSEYCYLHNPDIPEEVKKEAQSRGGEANKVAVKEPLPPISIKTPQDILILAEDTINRVRAGEIDPRVATTIGYLANVAQKAIEASNLDERLEVVESILLQRKTSFKKR